ncbi:similar to Saccharomyces cerevisiae YKL150W MCR1 Mitochondrial NADH-cytochrome b5 reductase, involved in ergosterol biosynthesis [Maudiozyma saulgeensis]|uniref:NADH-cytochrome b5 reductase n=1 Tax=Maudiozyma saulgeensis TaxID=1789683 RepID=A0A1X7R6X2_9SACH|nr:similar to Saccharomyces cerevisiae YKL150W MCR1 Mitochondrial NADH-cytochrome b5 reductase, involved in ergosterol biosynthesis [Kazachstania saulgeensis]
MNTILTKQKKLMPYIAGSIVLGGVAMAIYRRRQFSKSTAGHTFKGIFNSVELPIMKIIEETHDTKRLIFQLPADSTNNGLSLSSMILASAKVEDGSNVTRPYTPINKVNSTGNIELLVKHMPQGKMSGHLFGLNVGDKVSFRGAVNTYKYIPNKFDVVTLLGAGSGITPLYQLASNVIEDPENKTKIKLLYGNKTINDIPLKRELDQLQFKYPEKFEVVYFVSDSTTEDFKGEIGNINKDYLKSNIAGPKENTQLFVCGPTGFMKAVSGEKKNLIIQGSLSGYLQELGYSKSQVHKF